MQGELDGESTNVPISLMAINQAGFEFGNDGFTSGRDIPLLQEQSGDAIWDDWEVTYRDVIIVDAAGNVAGIYNLTQNSLGNASNYDTLKQMLIDTANAP